jgi:pimeloyl-ACP methyl ester carboxylesterase
VTGAWLSAAGVAARVESVDGLRIRYVRRGSGPAVVLLHGIASSLFTWKDVLPDLATDHDVVAMDLPGFGGSDIPARPSVDALRAAVVGLMDRLSLERASLVGNSLGGATAAFVAARHPDRVERLVLIDAAGFNLSPEARPWLLRASGGPVGAAISWLPRPRPLFALGLRQVFHDDTLVTRERLDEYEAPLLRPGAVQGMRALLNAEAPSEDEFQAMLRALRAPTLVIWGEEDRWIPVADAHRFAAAIPGARKVVLPRCGHMPQEERPADVVALLREVL